MRDILQTLRNRHKDSTCYIIGTGLSIKKLKPSDFTPTDPIITLNLALYWIEKLKLDNPIYAMMKDGGNKNNCPNCGDECGYVYKPLTATLLLEEHTSKDCFPDYMPRYVFDAGKMCEFGWNEFSANCALKIAQLFGCRKIKLMGFDACTTGDLKKLYREEEYIYEHEFKCEQLRQQCVRMRSMIEQDKLDVEWILR